MNKRWFAGVFVFLFIIWGVFFVSALNWTQSGHDVYNTGYQNETINLRGGFVALWNYTNGSEAFDTSPVISNGIAYVGSNTSLVAFNLSTSGVAEIKWRHPTSLPIDSSPAILNSTVYYSGNNGVLYALNASSGNEIWNYSLGYSSSTNSPSVAYSGSNLLIYVPDKNGGNNAVLFSVNASSGKEVWNTTDSTSNSAYDLIGSPVVAQGTVYIPNSNGIVHAYNASNGNQIWNFTLSAGYTYSPPCYSRGVLYTPDGDNNVYALNATTGKQIWNYSEGSPGSFIEIDGCAIAKGVIYTQNYNGAVFAINASAGKEIWNFSSGLGASDYAQAPSVSNNYVFVVNSGGQVYALNINNGTKAANYSLSTLKSSISFPVISNNIVYVGTDTGLIGLGSLYPTVTFGSPTPSNGSFIDTSYIESNVTASISQAVSTITNVTLRIYNSTSLVGINSSSSSSFFWNITNLPDGNYTLNATANDTGGSVGYSELNTIYIDTVIPFINITSINASKGTFTFYSNASDPDLSECWYVVYKSGSIVSSKKTFSCNSSVTSSVSSSGTYNLSVSAQDAAGNVNTTNKTFSISIPVVSSGTSGGGAPACVTQWNCSSWSICSNGTETRTCTYPSGYCMPTTKKPSEVQTCNVTSSDNPNAGVSGSVNPLTNSSSENKTSPTVTTNTKGAKRVSSNALNALASAKYYILFGVLIVIFILLVVFTIIRPKRHFGKRRDK